MLKKDNKLTNIQGNHTVYIHFIQQSIQLSVADSPSDYIYTALPLYKMSLYCFPKSLMQSSYVGCPAASVKEQSVVNTIAKMKVKLANDF